MVEFGSKIDKERVRRAFDRAAARYDDSAVLQREIGARMAERLDVVRLAPTVILDAGAGTGWQLEQLMRRYPKARFVALDFAPAMLLRAKRRGSLLRRPHCVGGDLEHLPLRSSSVDLLYSNLALQWMENVEGAFNECLRVLRPGGLFVFTTFGPDTLRELRTAWQHADGVVTHVSGFYDMHDIGDMLVRSQFADPVVDVEYVEMTYDDVTAVMRDLKAIGASNATRDRRRALTGKSRIAAVRAAYENYRNAQGRLPATYEVVYGHAWAPEQRREGNEVRIPVATLRGRSR
jgi:malonyl-CoA O-methyltransferase